MVVPFLTLCTDICPLDTGNLLQVERALSGDGAAANVQLIELSIDPERDTPARLAAYSRLTGASWSWSPSLRPRHSGSNTSLAGPYSELRRTPRRPSTGGPTSP